MHGANYDPEGSYRHDPIDDIEPLEIDDSQDIREAEARAYLEAARKFLALLDEYAFYILNHHNPRLAMWVISYVHELKACNGKTCEDIAHICNLGKRNTRQAVDKEIQKFCDATGYDPASAMKKKGSSASYREARIASVIKSQIQKS